MQIQSWAYLQAGKEGSGIFLAQISPVNNNVIYREDDSFCDYENLSYNFPFGTYIHVEGGCEIWWELLGSLLPMRDHEWLHGVISSFHGNKTIVVHELRCIIQ